MVETKDTRVSCAFSPKFTKKGEGSLTTMGETMAIGVLKRAGGDVVCAHCELADTPLKRMRGLLGRSELGYRLFLAPQLVRAGLTVHRSLEDCHWRSLQD